MSRQAIFKLIVVLVTAAAALLIVVVFDPFEVEEVDFIDPGSIEGQKIDEEVANKLYATCLRSSAPRHQFDPISAVTLRPSIEQTIEWPEHENGRIVIRTNSSGFREDDPTRVWISLWTTLRDFSA